jgi:hypothetical protein
MHKTIVVLRAPLLFTVPTRIRQQLSSVPYCTLPYVERYSNNNNNNNNSTLPQSNVVSPYSERYNDNTTTTALSANYTVFYRTRSATTKTTTITGLFGTLLSFTALEALQ